MRTKIFKIVLLTLCLLFMTSLAWAQAGSDNYELTVGAAIGGGGNSASDSYNVIGAVLSPAGVNCVSDSYHLTGGIIGAEAASITAEYTGGNIETVPITPRTLTVNYSGVTAATGTFHFRYGGEISYRSANMTPGNGVLSYEVQTDVLTSRGLEFYFIVDVGTMTIPVGLPEEPFVFIVEMTNEQGQKPTPLPDAAYRIVGLPLNTFAHDVESLFGDDLGPYDKKNWRMGRYLSATGTTAEYPEVTACYPGRGYWLIAKGGRTYGAAGSSVMPNFEHSGQAYYRPSFTLDTGWNQLANPYAFNINWNEVLFQDGAVVQVGHPASVLDDAAWTYSGSGYVNSSTITGWGGFFVHINKAGIHILFPYHEAGAAKTAPENQSPAVFDDWAINLRLESGGMVDGFNQVGVKADAAIGRDRYDHLEPPPPPGGPSLALKVGENIVRCTDFRPPFDDGAVWSLCLKDCAAGSKLIINGLDNIPGGMQAWIKKNGSMMKVDETTPLAVSEGDFEMQLIIGTPAYLAGETNTAIPVDFALEQNYPNPFNPITNIKFGIPEPGRATLEVFNVLGQKVRTLVDEFLPVGRYVLTWDGCDSDGHEVGSGVYFYRLSYRDFTEQRKMMLLK